LEWTVGLQHIHLCRQHWRGLIDVQPAAEERIDFRPVGVGGDPLHVAVNRTALGARIDLLVLDTVVSTRGSAKKGMVTYSSPTMPASGIGCPTGLLGARR